MQIKDYWAVNSGATKGIFTVVSEKMGCMWVLKHCEGQKGPWVAFHATMREEGGQKKFMPTFGWLDKVNQDNFMKTVKGLLDAYLALHSQQMELPIAGADNEVPF